MIEGKVSASSEEWIDRIIFSVIADNVHVIIIYAKDFTSFFKTCSVLSTLYLGASLIEA